MQSYHKSHTELGLPVVSVVFCFNGSLIGVALQFQSLHGNLYDQVLTSLQELQPKPQKVWGGVHISYLLTPGWLGREKNTHTY